MGTERATPCATHKRTSHHSAVNTAVRSELEGGPQAYLSNSARNAFTSAMTPEYRACRWLIMRSLSTSTGRPLGGAGALLGATPTGRESKGDRPGMGHTHTPQPRVGGGGGRGVTTGANHTGQVV
jgi:hypothetical protein